MPEQREDRPRQLHDEGNGAEQGQTQHQRQADAHRRAIGRCASGSLLVTMAMKIRLSMPSTTSIAINATSAAHA